MGKQIGLHLLATLGSLFVGLELLGIAGADIFPVTLAILVNIRNNGAWMEGN